MVRKYSEDDALNAMMPARNLRVVTPSDEDDLPDGPCDSLWVNDEGVVVVAVVAVDDTDAVLMAVSGPGAVIARARAVRETGTTAIDIVAMY